MTTLIVVCVKDITMPRMIVTATATIRDIILVFLFARRVSIITIIILFHIQFNLTIGYPIPILIISRLTIVRYCTLDLISDCKMDSSDNAGQIN